MRIAWSFRARIVIILSLFTFHFSPITSQTTSRQFTTERPLVYEDAWDLWPYTYLNENGDPEGYNIDLLKLLCKEMNIPYIIKLKPTVEALQDLKDGKSDLMMGMDADFHDEYGRYSNTVIQLFTHSVVYPKSKPREVMTMDDLANHKVIVHAGAFSHHLMEDKGWGKNAVPYDDMKEAIVVAEAQQDMPIVWNTLSLKWLMHRFNTKDLEISPIDIPHGEYRFMSNNDELLAKIDKAYTTLQTSDQIQKLQNKWFYPERQETEISPWVWKTGIILGIIALGSLVYYVILHIRKRQITSLIQQTNHQLSLILKVANVRLFVYNVDKDTFTIVNESGSPKRTVSSEEFSQYTSPENSRLLMQQIRRAISEEEENITFEINALDGTHPVPRDFVAMLSVLRRDKMGRPTAILGTRSDITEVRKRQQKAKDMMQRYEAVFNTALVDMVYYDEYGMPIDMNKKSMETFQTTPAGFRSEGIPFYKRIGMTEEEIQSYDPFYASCWLNFSKDAIIPKKDKYKQAMLYELQLIPLRDELNKIKGYYGTGHDITGTAQNYYQLQYNLKSIEEATVKVKSYIDNINYALRVGGVRLVNYSPSNHQLQIFTETDKVMMTLAQARSLHLCEGVSKLRVGRQFEVMDNLTDRTVSAEIKTILRDKKGHALYLQFYLMPTYDKDGKVNGYFGICRDISDIKATEIHLEEETVKAQEVETVKNSFLHNMSYEIRTPLNTVVGFAELFQQPHSAEDETVFIDEIKKNSRKLLNLVNNILFLSRLDARMIEFSQQPTDFAATFETHCSDGWAEYMKPGVSYVVESIYKRFVAYIDDNNLGIVIANITANAAQFTEHGAVHTSFGYTGDHLVVTIDDTGCGIPESELSHIFERFTTGANNGSGLGLSICYELVHQMGGSINIKSEVGKGTTVWVNIPCQVTEFERK